MAVLSGWLLKKRSWIFKSSHILKILHKVDMKTVGNILCSYGSTKAWVWTKQWADLTFWTMTRILTHSVLKLNTAESYGKAIEPCICEIWARRVFSKLWGDYFSTENCIFLTIVQPYSHPSLLQLQIPAKWILIYIFIHV